MRQQSGVPEDEMEDIDNDKYDNGAEGEEANSEEGNSEEDVVEGNQQSGMPQELQKIVIDIGLLGFIYAEEYQTQ